MKRETRRQIGAVSGLIVGITLMWALGFGGMIPGFIFGAGGTVAGAMLGESLGSEQGKS